MNSHSLSDGMLGDYCDGELYSNHPLFQNDPCALQIQLYFDELELCNPLGSKTHKLGKTIHLSITETQSAYCLFYL